MTDHSFQKGDKVTDSIRLMEVVSAISNGIWCRWNEGPNDTERSACFAPERLKKVEFGKPQSKKHR